MIATITDKKQWDTALGAIGNYDTYHTYEYHHLVKDPQEKPILFLYTQNEIIIAIALLIRTIAGTHYKDATCVYGYCGPISKNLPPSYDNSSFRRALKDYFTKNSIISVFSRLHSFICSQTNILRNIGQVESLGNIVTIDITKNPDVQQRGYHKRLRTYINKSRRLCTIRLAETENDIETFIALYYETMQRTKAHKRYFFPKKYFYKLMSSVDFECPMLLVLDSVSSDIIGGSMFLIKNNIVHYHLSCANNRGLEYNAIKLVIDEMRLQATQKKYLYYNLGGGLGSKEDSLFYFKSSFSKDHRPFKVWKYIVNPLAYNELCELNSREKTLETNFFPKYRS